MKTETHLYKEISVWKRIDEKTLARYRCFQIIPGDKYCVQNADFYNLPVDHVQANFFSEQFFELLSEEEPETRAGKVFDSLEEAIIAHDSDFNS